MAIKFHNPKSVVAGRQLQPRRRGAARARACSTSPGQVGVDSKGKLQVGIDKQVETVWKNIIQVLKSGGMGLGDIVKVNVFLTDSRFIVPYRARPRLLLPRGCTFPASTLLIVQGLADPRHAGRGRGRGRQVGRRRRCDQESD